MWEHLIDTKRKYTFPVEMEVVFLTHLYSVFPLQNFVVILCSFRLVFLQLYILLLSCPEGGFMHCLSFLRLFICRYSAVTNGVTDFLPHETSPSPMRNSPMKFGSDRLGFPSSVRLLPHLFWYATVRMKVKNLSVSI